MGLDITVYTRVEPATDVPRQPDGKIDYEACWKERLSNAFVYEGFEQSYAGLPVVEDPDSDFYGNAWVRSTGESWHFRAGSYSGYNSFRRTLSMAVLGVEPGTVWANPDAYRDKPFFELINFADNEGTIGHEAAARLAHDFDEHRERVLPSLPDDWYRECYDTWQKACHDASDGGMIDFH